MRVFLSAALAMLVIAGCERPLSNEEQLKRGLPSTDAVTLKVPDSGSGGGAQKGQGELAAFYVVTRATTLVLNGGTAFVLGVVKSIVSHTPTTVEKDMAVWGPHTDALSPNTWKLTVNRTSPNHYAYVLEGKAKNDPDTAYVTVLSGTHAPALDAQGEPLENYGEGTFLIDWTTEAALPEHDSHRGTVDVTYSHLTSASPVQIDMQLTGVRDDSQPVPVTAQYRYDSTAGQGGSFSFIASGNIDADPAKTAAETLSVHSRWLETGAGRSDALVSGGDFTSETQVSECWDANFLSRFVSFNGVSVYGVELQSCAFTSAEFSP